MASVEDSYCKVLSPICVFSSLLNSNKKWVIAYLSIRYYRNINTFDIDTEI